MNTPVAILRSPSPNVGPRSCFLRAELRQHVRHAACLDCHLQGRVKRPSRYLPTIELSSDYRFGHPYARHPVNGSPDPISGGELSCISCHLPHGGNKLHQLRMGTEIPEDALNQNTETKDMCEKCHMKLWGMDGPEKAKNKHKSEEEPVIMSFPER
jgi:hypothetical protein